MLAQPPHKLSAPPTKARGRPACEGARATAHRLAPFSCPGTELAQRRLSLHAHPPGDPLPEVFAISGRHCGCSKVSSPVPRPRTFAAWGAGCPLWESTLPPLLGCWLQRKGGEDGGGGGEDRTELRGDDDAVTQSFRGMSGLPGV